MTPLERLLTGPGPIRAALRAQFEVVSAVSREWTGAGFFTGLHVPPAGAPPAAIEDGALGGPEFVLDADGLEQGAGFVVWIEGGRLQMLEGYSFDEPWPAP